MKERYHNTGLRTLEEIMNSKDGIFSLPFSAVQAGLGARARERGDLYGFTLAIDGLYTIDDQPAVRLGETELVMWIHPLFVSINHYRKGGEGTTEHPATKEKFEFELGHPWSGSLYKRHIDPNSGTRIRTGWDAAVLGVAIGNVEVTGTTKIGNKNYKNKRIVVRDLADEDLDYSAPRMPIEVFERYAGNIGRVLKSFCTRMKELVFVPKERSMALVQARMNGDYSSATKRRLMTGNRYSL
jgi:hypothetical protein